jgi:long-chain acyl-CoA synthetase
MSLFEAPRVDVQEGDSVSARIAAAAKLNPEKAALICDDETISWAEFDQRVNRIANALIAMGVKHGDNVAMLSRNSPEMAETFIGTIRAGACFVPLSTMADAQSLKRMIDDSGSKVFLLSDGMRDLAAPFIDDLPGVISGGLIAVDFEADGWTDYASWRDAAKDEDPGLNIGLGDDFNIIYSSGTTGVPKGILHSNGVRTGLCNSFANFGVSADSISALSTPLYSNTTIVTFLPTLAHGGTVVLMRKFDVAGYLALVEKYKCNVTMLVPVQYQRIMAFENLADYDLSSMQVKLSTSAPLRAPLKRDILDRFPGLMIEVYGLTEGGGGTVLVCNEFPDKLESVGQPGMDTELKIIDENLKELPPGETGEIVARSPSMMTGYFKREDLTGDIIWTDGDGKTYFRSGDVGRLDSDGFLFLGDRLKDMIISGGLNIFANDLELALLKHDDITDAAVVAVPSEDWGETPLAFVVKAKDSDLGSADLLAWVNGQLGKAQRISAIEFKDELPRSSIGKILKRELREPYWRDQA